MQYWSQSALNPVLILSRVKLVFGFEFVGGGYGGPRGDFGCKSLGHFTDI